MINQSEVQALIQRALELARGYLADEPGDEVLTYVISELERIGAEVRAGWPLTASQKDRIEIGVLAVREIEGWHDDLADLLEDIDWYVTNDGKEPEEVEHW